MTRPSALHLFARAVACAVFILILAGASVTSTDSGLAVPDWPLSYGQVMPPMQGGVFFEHGHRMIASLVGLLTLVLAGWTWASGAGRTAVRLGFLAAGMVILQGLLGGITVLYRLPAPVSVAHACLGQAFFCVIVALALWTSPEWVAPASTPAAGRRALSRLSVWAWATAGLFYLQLILGAAYRHNAGGLMPHILNAGLASAVALACVYRVVTFFFDVPGFSRPAFFVAGFLFVQVGLGLWAYVSRSPIGATFHVGVGALLLAGSVVLALRVQRAATVPAEPQTA